MNDFKSFSFKGVEIEARIADDSKIAVFVDNLINEDEESPSIKLYLNGKLLHGEQP